MRERRLGRPSPALVIAVVALVVAMVGTGYGAINLPKNSVGTKQLKKNAVNGAKVKNRSLTGKDINLKKLGTVPSAASAASAGTANTATNAVHAGRADSAALADSIPPAEQAHLVGAPGEPGFEGGSSNLPGERGIVFQPVGFYKDHDGIVHLQGIAAVGEGGSLPGLIFRLPPGFRPKTDTVLAYNVFCSSFVEGAEGECSTDEAGDELQEAGILLGGSNAVITEGETSVDLTGAIFAPAGVAVSLDGVTFRAES
jgi:hypothetical protein